jgi:hypothetical protein
MMHEGQCREKETDSLVERWGKICAGANKTDNLSWLEMVRCLEHMRCAM